MTDTDPTSTSSTPSRQDSPSVALRPVMSDIRPASVVAPSQSGFSAQQYDATGDSTMNASDASDGFKRAQANTQQPPRESDGRIPQNGKKSLLSSVVAISKMGRQAQLRVLPVVAAQTQNRLIRSQSLREQQKRTRSSRLKALAKIAKPTALVLVVLLIGIAGIVDVLDIIKEPIAEIPYVGWTINFLLGIVKALCIGVPTWFMARKVKHISDAAKRVVDYGEKLRREAEMGLARVTPFALEMKRADRLVAANPDEEVASLKQFVLYKSRILLNQVIAQVLEAIPLLDLGPWQTIRVVKAYRDQQAEYRKARAAIVACQLIGDKLDAQAKIEIDYVTLCLRLIQKLLIQASRRGVSGFIADTVDTARAQAFGRSKNPVERGGYDAMPSLQPQPTT